MLCAEPGIGVYYQEEMRDLSGEELNRELLKALALQLLAVGLSAEEMAGYLFCEEEHGCLRPGAPEWLKRSTLFRIERGESPDLGKLRVLRKMCSGLHEVEGGREDVFLVSLL